MNYCTNIAVFCIHVVKMHVTCSWIFCVCVIMGTKFVSTKCALETFTTQCHKSDNIIFFYSAIQQILWIHLKIQTNQGQAIFKSKNCTSDLQVTNTDASTQWIVAVWSLWTNAILSKVWSFQSSHSVRQTCRIQLGKEGNRGGLVLPWWSRGLITIENMRDNSGSLPLPWWSRANCCISCIENMRDNGGGLHLLSVVTNGWIVIHWKYNS